MLNFWNMSRSAFVPLGLAMMTFVLVIDHFCSHRCNTRSGIQSRAITVNSESEPFKQSLQDLGAHPVFSAKSLLSRHLQLKMHGRELIELDYEPLEIHNKMHYVELEDSLVSITLQRQLLCSDWEIFGNKSDGGWPVCKAKVVEPSRPCTVYSFGIKFDWSFDDKYREYYGCTLRTFDPSMGNTTEHEHIPGVYFYPIGLAEKAYTNSQGWRLNSYKNLLHYFNEQDIIIPYLKFDIDGMEWEVFENLLDDNVLTNVVQLSFEIHVRHLQLVSHYFTLFKRLEALGFRRWFYHHRLNGFAFQCDQSFINMNYV